MPKLTWTNATLTVTREPGDPAKFRGGGWGSGESGFLHWLKGVLNAQGYDLIKKRMWRDGHLVDDDKQYLRARNCRSKHNIALHNGRWAIEGLDDAWNRDGRAVLDLVTPYFAA